MSKKKVKGTKIDLRSLGDVTQQVALPKGPAERAEDDEGRFRRNHGGKGGKGYGDRDGGDRGGYGDRNDRGGGGFGDRNDRGDRGGGGFGDRNDRGGGGFGDRNDRGGGGFGDRNDRGDSGRKPLNLTSSRAPMNSSAPAPAGGLFGGRTGGTSAAPPPAPVDKWSKLESSMGGGGSSAQPTNSRFSGLRDGDRAGGQFSRDSAPPEARAGGRFGFVNDEPRESAPRSSGDSRNMDRPSGGSGGDYRGAAMQPTSVASLPAGDAASQVVANKLGAEMAEKNKAEEKAARAAKKAEEKAAEEAAKAAEKEAKKQAKAAKKAAEQKEIELATSVVSSGKKGNALVETLKSNKDEVPSAKSFVTAVLTSLSDGTVLTWADEAQYGAALKFLCAGKGSIQKQAGVVYACQIFYNGLKYPKSNESSGKRESLLAKLFFHLYNTDLIEEEAFNEWRYADDDDKEVPGKKDALFQLAEFLNFLDEPPSEDEDAEEEPVTFERVELRSK
jgi:hypothetical protein